MRKKIIYMFAMLVTCTAALASSPVLLDTNDISWKDLPVAPKLQYSVLSGNPEKHEFFVVRLKFPKDYTDIVHQHNSTRYDTVISGSFNFGFGSTVDKSKTQKLSAGGFIECPAKTKHYGYTDEGAVIQISGIGPWEALKTAGPNR